MRRGSDQERGQVLVAESKETRGKKEGRRGATGRAFTRRVPTRGFKAASLHLLLFSQAYLAQSHRPTRAATKFAREPNWSARSVRDRLQVSQAKRTNQDFRGQQTRSGRLIATIEHLADDSARWVMCSFFSDDESKPGELRGVSAITSAIC